MSAGNRRGSGRGKGRDSQALGVYSVLGLGLAKKMFAVSPIEWWGLQEVLGE